MVAAVTIFNQAGRESYTQRAPPVAAKGRGRSRTPPGRLGEAEVVAQALEARCVVCHELITDAPPGVIISDALPGVSPPRFVHKDPCEAIRNLAVHGRRRVLHPPAWQPFCPPAALRALEDAVTALRRDGVGVQCEACRLVDLVGSAGGPQSASCWRHGLGAGSGRGRAARQTPPGGDAPASADRRPRSPVAPVASQRPEPAEHPSRQSEG